MGISRPGPGLADSACRSGCSSGSSLIFRGIGPARKIRKNGEISTLFLLAALAIPLFYLPAMFFSSTTHYTVVDIWRFWIIHLWVEGFFELFVTTMVAVLFLQAGDGFPADRHPGHLPGCHPLSRERNHRHGASLVLDRAVKHHHGPCRHVFRHGGCATDTSHPGCLGLHQVDQGRNATSAGKKSLSPTNGPFTL